LEESLVEEVHLLLEFPVGLLLKLATDHNGAVGVVLRDRHVQGYIGEWRLESHPRGDIDVEDELLEGLLDLQKFQPVVADEGCQECIEVRKGLGSRRFALEGIEKIHGLADGDAKGRVFTFPIPTYNVTKDFNWDDPNLVDLWEMTAKYGIPYFSNFINSDMDPSDARSMCCRLRLDNRELKKKSTNLQLNLKINQEAMTDDEQHQSHKEIRGGGLFGANPMTGSIGVVTVNLPRLAYISKDRTQFFTRLAKAMDTAKESLEIKRKVLERFTEGGLYPYSKHYLRGIKQTFGKYWSNHFSTIGLVGMNEAALIMENKNIGDEEGRQFALETLKFMRERLDDYKHETNSNYNLEASPAEGTSYRLARKDKEKFPDINTAG